MALTESQDDQHSGNGNTQNHANGEKKPVSDDVVIEEETAKNWYLSNIFLNFLYSLNCSEIKLMDEYYNSSKYY